MVWISWRIDVGEIRVVFIIEDLVEIDWFCVILDFLLNRMLVLLLLFILF